MAEDPRIVAARDRLTWYELYLGDDDDVLEDGDHDWEPLVRGLLEYIEQTRPQPGTVTVNADALRRLVKAYCLTQCADALGIVTEHKPWCARPDFAAALADADR